MVSVVGFLAWYSQKLDTHPLLTKGLSSGLIAASGDVLCQALLLDDDNHERDNGQRRRRGDDDSHKGEAKAYSAAAPPSILDWWDKPRTARFWILGTFLVAPVIHVWFGTLARQIPGSTFWPVVKRVGCDQFFFAPIFMSTWLVSLWTLEGRTNCAPADATSSRCVISPGTDRPIDVSRSRGGRTPRPAPHPTS